MSMKRPKEMRSSIRSRGARVRHPAGWAELGARDRPRPTHPRRRGPPSCPLPQVPAPEPPTPVPGKLLNILGSPGSFSADLLLWNTSLSSKQDRIHLAELSKPAEPCWRPDPLPSLQAGGQTWNPQDPGALPSPPSCQKGGSASSRPSGSLGTQISAILFPCPFCPTLL